MATVTRDVIAQLIEEGSWTERAKSVERLGSRFSEGGLDEQELQAAGDAFRVALFDAEPLVRRVLAESVKFANDVPRDVVLALARDTAAVAAPMLEHSRLLSEDDLLPIAQHGSPSHRLAIAGRRLISGRLAAVLCRSGERETILRLVANEGAAITEASLHWLIDTYPEDKAITDIMSRRRLLPVSVAGRLAALAPKRDGGQGPALRLVWDRTGSLG